MAELARALASTATRVGLGWSASDVRGRLDADPDSLRRVADDLLAVGPATHQRLLVSIDQTEELFTRTTPVALQGFAQLLPNAVTGPVQVVAAMRSEFLDDLRDLPALAGAPIEAFVLAPLDREMLRDVIEQPAKVARLRLEDGLAAALVADTGSGEALVVIGSNDATVQVWDLAVRGAVGYPLHVTAAVQGVAVCRSGRDVIAVIVGDGVTRVDVELVAR